MEKNILRKFNQNIQSNNYNQKQKINKMILKKKKSIIGVFMQYNNKPTKLWFTKKE